MQCPTLAIVDDDDQIRSIVHELAQTALPAAHIVDHHCCSEALQQIEKGGVNLLITNCHMPDMDGPTMVRKLRELKNSIPIIMVSGSDDARELGEKAGIDRFVPKVRLHAGLAEAIHALLDAA
jgi:DNA-binding response OmpR family regulator